MDIYKEFVIPKGSKFTLKMLQELDYNNINANKWTTDKDRNDQIKELLHNYNIRMNDIIGSYKRKKFAVQVGDELPAGIMQLAKCILPRNVNLQ